MIDATKLPRPAATAVSAKSQERIARRSVAAEGQTEALANDQAASHSSRSLVLDSGRYYTVEVKK